MTTSVPLLSDIRRIDTVPGIGGLRLVQNIIRISLARHDDVCGTRCAVSHVGSAILLSVISRDRVCITRIRVAGYVLRSNATETSSAVTFFSGRLFIFVVIVDVRTELLF